tara:strand:- start:69 stop:1160 length:1092 start_codon:yes stop_codon:yes gene_type:complete
MNICLIGNGLTNIVLAKNLLNKKIKVDLFCEKKKFKKNYSRTISISKENLNFLKKEVIDIKEICWAINKIQIFNETNQKKNILNFNTFNSQAFSIVKNNEFFDLIYKEIKKNKNFKKKQIKNNLFYNKILNDKKYDLIINSDFNSIVSKNLFYNRIKKNYKSKAYTTFIRHEKCANNIATQIFTRFGPIAFLPYSKYETSIVFSFLHEHNKTTEEIKNYIFQYNKKYKIKKIGNIEKFNLKFSILRNYYYKNILSFGENLHQIHPLAGQGFNMTIRDIKVLSNLIDYQLDLGLPLDESLLKKFESKTRHFNYVFAHGVDFIHEFFKFDNKFNNIYSNNVVKLLGNNKLFNKYISKFADKGFSF